jgi:hypothetical protein
MRYTVDKASDGMTYIPGFMRIGCGLQVMITFLPRQKELGYRCRYRDWLRPGRPRGQEFSLLHFVQTGSGIHPASYPVGTGGPFPGGKAAGAFS